MSSLLYIGEDDLVNYTAPTASGTPEYIAPEQVRGTDGDGRTDLYSAGVVLFETLAGRRPFENASAERLLEAHLGQQPPWFADVLGPGHGIPPAVEAVVRRCLAKSPAERPASAAALAEDYQAALGRRLAAPAPAPEGLGDRSRGAALSAPAGHGSAPRRSGAFPVPPPDRNALRQSFEAAMPEAMAMLKLKGFIHDLGGEVVESVPGMIKVRLAEPSRKKTSGLFRLLGAGGATAVQAPPATEIELHMERHDPAQPNRLTVTLVLRSSGGATPEWQSRCQKICLDLQAYLMGR
jgi:serine/threonine-protein kinase